MLVQTFLTDFLLGKAIFLSIQCQKGLVLFWTQLIHYVEKNHCKHLKYLFCDAQKKVIQVWNYMMSK